MSRENAPAVWTTISRNSNLPLSTRLPFRSAPHPTQTTFLKVNHYLKPPPARRSTHSSQDPPAIRIMSGAPSVAVVCCISSYSGQKVIVHLGEHQGSMSNGCLLRVDNAHCAQKCIRSLMMSRNYLVLRNSVANSARPHDSVPDLFDWPAPSINPDATRVTVQLTTIAMQ